MLSLMVSVNAQFLKDKKEADWKSLSIHPDRVYITFVKSGIQTGYIYTMLWCVEPDGTTTRSTTYQKMAERHQPTTMGYKMEFWNEPTWMDCVTNWDYIYTTETP